MNATTPLANILIVDDRRENLLVTEKVLKNLPARLFTAESGNEAPSLMLRYKFAVVILDVQMPGMDGFEVAQLMQEEESMRGTPIIFITAISKEDKYASRAGEIGAVDYIFKPINPEILRSKVSVYLDLYAQREHILHLNADLQQSIAQALPAGFLNRIIGPGRRAYAPSACIFSGRTATKVIKLIKFPICLKLAAFGNMIEFIAYSHFYRLILTKRLTEHLNDL